MLQCYSYILSPPYGDINVSLASHTCWPACCCCLMLSAVWFLLVHIHGRQLSNIWCTNRQKYQTAQIYSVTELVNITRRDTTLLRYKQRGAKCNDAFTDRRPVSRRRDTTWRRHRDSEHADAVSFTDVVLFVLSSSFLTVAPHHCESSLIVILE